MIFSLTYPSKVFFGLVLIILFALPIQAAPESVTLSDGTSALAKSLGIVAPLNQLQTLKNASKPDRNELNAQRVELLQSVLITSYEMRSVINKIDKEIAQSAEIDTYISEQRDKALRINTYV